MSLVVQTFCIAPLIANTLRRAHSRIAEVRLTIRANLERSGSIPTNDARYACQARFEEAYDVLAPGKATP